MWAALLLALMLFSPTLHAHVGGHGPVAAGALHAWTNPSTGSHVRGSIAFVTRGFVHVEDAGGRMHVWQVSGLTPDDRAIVDAYELRTASLVARPASVFPPLSTPRVDGWDGAAWGVAAVCLCLGACVRRAPAVRWGSAIALAVAVPMACGGKSPATPSPTSATTPTSTVASTSTSVASTTTSTIPGGTSVSSYFAAFSAHVHAWQDSRSLYVESDGMADHVLMTGIRSWQQQVPLPQSYRGANAWTIPLQPRLADQPVSARTNLFRGAIALAVNGVPIFNALNNRGDDAYLFGELDDFGGHSGRADDYHYHAAPLFLEAIVGRNQPIGIALDGFLIFGGTEPDGSPVRGLDDYNGHADAATTYHYHGTKSYPYINGGMKGVVTVKDGQVDPQPTTTPIRPAGTPLAGATVTAWTATAEQAWRLEYALGGRTYRVDYRVQGGHYTFVFTDPTGATRTETYDR